MAPLALLRQQTAVARRSPPSAQGASEAFILPVKMNAECTRAIRPRGKRPPQHCGGRLPQAAVIQRIVCKRACFSAEAAKGVRGKAKGFSPNGALRAPGCGAGLGLPRRKATHLPPAPEPTRTNMDANTPRRKAQIEYTCAEMICKSASAGVN